MKVKEKKIIVFTDLDGSFLDNDYDYGKIESYVQNLLLSNVAIVFISSKTRNEIDFYRKKLQITDPFIVENGSAILIPKDYFTIKYEFSNEIEGYNVIKLGLDYYTVRNKLETVKQHLGVNILGFGNMDAKEIEKETGLPFKLAKLAKKREYSEPFKILSGDKEEVLGAIKNEGIRCTWGGKFLNVSANSDKGKAAAILKNLYFKEFKEIFTIGVGNSENDLPFLKVVDQSFYVGNIMEIERTWKEIELLIKRNRESD